jgi:lipopolysaccharide export system protein LptA
MKVFRAGILGCLLLPVFLASQEKTQPVPLRLVYADSLIGTVHQGKTATRLAGRVQMVQGEAYLSCREAYWFERENRIQLFRDVAVHDGKRTLRADRVDYDGENKTESASGNAVLESPPRKISAQKLTYWQIEEKALAEGGAMVEDLLEKAVLRGNRITYDRKADFCTVEDGPALTKTDTATQKTWTILGRIMKAWGKEQRAEVEDSVSLRQEDLEGFCTRLRYFADPLRLILTGSPRVRQRTQTLRGDSMVIRLSGTRFAGAVIVGKAEMSASDSTGEDKLKGECITIEAERDTIRHIQVEKRAESTYRVTDDKGAKQGLNTVTGDRIDLFFENDRLRKVDVTSRPGLCAGTYVPETRKESPPSGPGSPP